MMAMYGETTLANYLNLIEDLCMDSLDHVELIVTFEDEYKLKISDIDAEQWKTVGDIIKYLKTKGCK